MLPRARSPAAVLSLETLDGAEPMAEADARVEQRGKWTMAIVILDGVVHSA